MHLQSLCMVLWLCVEHVSCGHHLSTRVSAHTTIFIAWLQVRPLPVSL